MKVLVQDLKKQVAKGVNKLGYTGEDAEVIIETLLYAEMRKNNQGITKIATGGVPEAKGIEELKVMKKSKCGALLSGGHSMVATARAADMAIELAESHGVGIVGCNHTFTSSGAIGFFARRIAKHGYIGMVCVGNGSFRIVAPSGSAEPQFGTNPFSYAFPYNEGEVVFDNATAAMAFFGIIEAKLKGESLPDGVGYDQEGNPSKDPESVLNGSLKTFAEHKGYALSLFVQMLGGPFTLAATPGVNEKDGAGTFVLAIDPGLLAGKEQFMERATELIHQIKNSKPLEGSEVLLPGEHGDAIARAAEQSGEIEIADAIWNELKTFVNG